MGKKIAEKIAAKKTGIKNLHLIKTQRRTPDRQSSSARADLLIILYMNAETGAAIKIFVACLAHRAMGPGSGWVPPLMFQSGV